jgi:SAM-dependent methyltransferase
MASSDALSPPLRHQADDHPLVELREDASVEERGLQLIHLKAYEEAARVATDRDVLDLGCNTGYGTVRIASVARRVVGADVSARAIDVARARPEGGPVTWVVVDGGPLPFEDDSFDLVTSFQVIEHLEDPVPWLREIARVLRAGGSAILTTPNAAIRLDAGMTPWNRFHVREFRAAELDRLLGQVFASVRVRGLFGTPTLTETELRRVRRARRLARIGGYARPALEFAPLRTVVDGLRRRRRRRRRRDDAMQTRDRERFTTDDLFYADHDLERALDLIAICTTAG